ncbi:MAG: hypothetical protein HY903_21050 [Deltaproteobacteria bacterium]|nr:hypothetical protein [Deltaproteobacteria bacterium]
MSSPIAAAAAELELLVTRAARRGRIDPAELVPAYARLKPGNHPHLADPRRVDLDALVAALNSLPPGFVTAPRLSLVPRLGLFAHAPLSSPVFPAGVLEDHSLIAECRFGQVSLVSLAASLCVVVHERDKARALLADTPVNPASFGAAAFALGVDELGLLAANEATGGALAELFAGAALPEIVVHPALCPDAVKERAVAQAERRLALIAEMGLLQRPIHLWLGSPVLSDCLSPYGRDLRQLLCAWGERHPEALGEDLVPLVTPVGEDATYGLLYDFLQSDPGLVAERAAADRSVGIVRHHDDDGAAWESIDLGRIDRGAVDARLLSFPEPAPTATILRLPVEIEDDDAHGLRTLLAALGPSLRSVTVLLAGTALSGRSGEVWLPQLLVRFAGETKLSVPGAVTLAADALAGFADGGVSTGAALAVTSASLLNPAAIMELARTYGVGALSVGGAGLVAALADARWSGQLGADVSVAWALVTTAAARTGRPLLPTLAAQSGVAVARLRSLFLTGVTGPAVEPEPEPASPGRRRGSGRGVRIKA